MYDATPREAIAEVLSIEKRRPHTRQMIGGITSATWDEADAVIAHLWRRGTDWDTTVVKVACILVGEVKCDVAPDSYHAKLEGMADEIVATLLTALIGPRPAEQESHDE